MHVTLHDFWNLSHFFTTRVKYLSSGLNTEKKVDLPTYPTKSQGQGYTHMMPKCYFVLV